MGKDEMKIILDSVHGYIHIERAYITNIVDTPYFQRLRRVEQTSTRAVFPSARHDRFIHSLGVYHLGYKIVEHLAKSLGETAQTKPIFESYKLACLLHDVAHTPFSHTFEKFFDNQWSDLRGDLKALVKEAQFDIDWDNTTDPSAPHERLSAIVALGVFGDFITSRGASKELVARMIIGLKYSDNALYSLENSMIELIHGDVIDADGLDYACRDTWAAGYSTTSIDVDRLIDSINIVEDEGIYKLCFTAKCLNEIESVLHVKTFQQYYVINHHTVAYEQRLLVKSVESAAQFHFYGHVNDNQDERETALAKLCNVKAFYDVSNPGLVGIETDSTHIKISLPKDDDFVSLMSYIPNDKYVKQWFSRQYELKPLWKTKADFYDHFDQLREVRLLKGSWIFSNDCLKFISDRFGIQRENIWRVRATAKYKGNFAEKVSIYVHDHVVPYDKLLPKDIQSYEPPKNEYYYIFVPVQADISSIIAALKEEYVKFFMLRAE